MSRRSDRASRERRLPAVILAIAGTLLALSLRAAEPDMDAEIDFLVKSVAASDCTFIRNGKEHDAKAATSHLQMKRKRGQRYFDTTEEFIERIASRSSWTGKDYLIRCDDGAAETASEWFKARLAEYRAAPPG